ncbi:hypothetical protein GB931_02440 [Modestobacter sp. I12A-02628]|uniref:Integral membrane protein n=1 Tax=Goekera deserti TaxID=2497753 RepID=A0A7K3WDL4_9ACTN|nr:hypothetical protein [Goekera deserti]MPQ96797.1 hypothetical protein [Goekera deserti]NDI46889.1 hypothetical protein [Goekera deserti]NEL54457.1 hypothetical protein [Goekera deserti]
MQAQEPGATGGPTVELRTHGAAGSSPEDLLGSPVVVQVAGDGAGRFFRPADGRGTPLPARDGHVLEGYHWGLFTSGSWVQGLWFLLLPFGAVNLAAHALPPAAGRRARSTALAALRLLGLALSATFALGVVQVLVDLLARQGPGQGRRAAVLAALAGVLLVLGVVAVLGRGRVGAAPPGTRTVDAEDPPATVLADPAFYRGDPDVPVLRRLHGVVGLAVVAVPAGAQAGVPALPAALLAAAALLGVLLGDPLAPAPRLRRGDGPRPVLGWLVTVLLVATAGAAAVLWALVLTGRAPARGPLPGTAGLTAALVAAGAGCLLVLLVAVAGAARRGTAADTPPPFRPLAGGLAGWVLAALGAHLGIGFTAGLVWATRWAVGGEVAGLYRGVAGAWGFAVLLLAAGALVVLAGRGRALRRLRARAAAARALVAPTTPATLLDATAAALWRAGLRRHLPAALVGLAVLGTVTAPVLLAGVTGAVPGRPAGVLVAVGTVALVGFAAGLLLVGRGAVSSPAVRRGVNVLWDVVAFWPREVHPVVPPPYSQRAVADVADRVAWHLTAGGAARVVLTGHSQGSLLCLAALVHLPAGLRDRVALVTHGSQLQVAYARVFPAAVPVALLRWVLRALGGRWRSLFRDTDPFAGAVLSWDRSAEEAGPPWTSTRLAPAGAGRGDDVVDEHGTRRCGRDWRLLDPAVVDPQRRPWPGLRGHADAASDPAWPAAVADVWRG